jgi:hypothetical protein
MTPRTALATWLKDFPYAILTVLIPTEAPKSLMILISMPPNDSHWRSVGLEEGDFACAVV